MAKLIRVPELGIAIANVTIVEWLIKEGEPVTRGQPLLNVETDKIVMEVPAEATGVLLKILNREDSELKIGAPIAIIGREGESFDEILNEIQDELEATGARASRHEVVLAEAGSAVMATSSPSISTPAPNRKPGTILASPLAKRMARERGIDLAQVRPSGKGGRITKDDVVHYSEQIQSAPKPLVESPTAGEDEGEVEIIPLRGIRKTIADNMIRSLRTAAHFTMGADIDCGELVALRSKLKEEFKTSYGLDLTYVPFMVKAIALAVKDVPIVNATIRDNNIIVHKVAHVGVAIASDDYIYVPVIRKPIAKTLLRVTQELTEYVRKVRDNELTPAHMRGGTITLTNIGVVDTAPRAGFTIINQPEVAIITLGRIKDTVVPVGGEIGIRPMLDVTFTYDHRVVMGVPGGRFGDRFKYYVENPELLLAC